MYIKVYFNDRPLYLCNEIHPEIEPYLHHDDALFMDELDAHAIKTMIYEMQLPQVHAGVFYHADFEALKKAFFKKFILLQSAGGLVFNEKKEALMIYRKGHWDLPKGKLDKGESLELCAVREVEEETGLKNVQLVALLIITYHTYHEGTRFILKESHWYTMKAHKDQRLTPQTEEDITAIEWVAKKDIPDRLSKAYALISDVFAATGKH